MILHHMLSHKSSKISTNNNFKRVRNLLWLRWEQVDLGTALLNSLTRWMPSPSQATLLNQLISLLIYQASHHTKEFKSST